MQVETVLVPFLDHHGHNPVGVSKANRCGDNDGIVVPAFPVFLTVDDPTFGDDIRHSGES